MSVDHRTRLRKDVRDLPRDETFDEIIPTAATAHGDLAARGIAFRRLPPLAFRVDGQSLTIGADDGGLTIESGEADAGIVAELEASALSDLVQDVQSTMGLAMTSRVQVAEGSLDYWVGWEPALRALFDGRPVHEPGMVTMVDDEGAALDIDRRFSLDDDRDEMRSFIEQAGFLHVENVFTDAEMGAVADDLDRCLDAARPDDAESWWATLADGTDQAVRILWFHEKSDSLRPLLTDERLAWLGELTGDGHELSDPGAEGLVKPLDVVTGLSDLPWHKDCGQGGHSYMCNGLTIGISVTGADRESGALGVVPGSHRANTILGLDKRMDLEPRMLETRTGDITIHCSDTLHRAHPPTKRPRKVVYSGVRLPPMSGDVVPEPDERRSRAARARLTNVQDRIEAADNDDAENRYRANPSPSN